jgi:hypothetical protein
MCMNPQSGTADDCQYRTILITDIKDYTAEYRDDATRWRLRADLRGLTVRALGGSGIDGARYVMTTTGDGLLVMIDPAVSKPRILGPVVDRLDAGLREHNRQVGMPEQLFIRLVVHAGDVLVDQDGPLGVQLNQAFRLLDAQQLRVLLNETSGPLLSCVSDEVRRQVIAQRHGGLDPDAFEPVWLDMKHARGLGWVRAPREPGLAARTGLLAEDVLDALEV